MSRIRVPGDGPKCRCGAEATFSGYCNACSARTPAGREDKLYERAEKIASLMNREELADVATNGYRKPLGQYDDSTPAEEAIFRTAIQNEAKWRVAAGLTRPDF